MERKLPAWYLKHLAKIGSKGGKRSKVTMTKEARIARAKLAAKASAKVRKAKARSRRNQTV